MLRLRLPRLRPSRNLLFALRDRTGMATDSNAAAAAAAGSSSPMEDTIRTKLTEALSPVRLEIHNDSHLHSHHQAMRGSVSSETHFRLVVISPKFESQSQPARHRLIYKLLEDELQRAGGIHALQLKTRTPAEDEKQALKNPEADSGES